jgi:hypothetical protein
MLSDAAALANTLSLIAALHTRIARDRISLPPPGARRSRMQGGFGGLHNCGSAYLCKAVSVDCAAAPYRRFGGGGTQDQDVAERDGSPSGCPATKGFAQTVGESGVPIRAKRPRRPTVGRCMSRERLC